jgi:hypothetical protein
MFRRLGEPNFYLVGVLQGSGAKAKPVKLSADTQVSVDTRSARSQMMVANYTHR